MHSKDGWWTQRALPISERLFYDVDGWGLHIRTPEDPPYKVAGKYQFFSPNPWTLFDIAMSEIMEHGFHHAKISAKPPRRTGDYALMLYYCDASRKNELAKRWPETPERKYRYWKPDALTDRGVYAPAGMTEADLLEERRRLLAHLTAQGIPAAVVEKAIDELFGPVTLMTKMEAEARGLVWHEVDLEGRTGTGETGTGLVQVPMPRDEQGRWVWWTYLPEAGPYQT